MTLSQPHDDAFFAGRTLSAGTPLLRLDRISKSFPGVKALNEVSFDLRPGEVHALCGENGAGKSTLMKILAGSYRADSGTILLDGNKVDFHSILDARRRGILLVHQEISLVSDLSVAENLFMGNLPTRAGWLLDRRAMFANAQSVLQSCGYDIDARRTVDTLSIAQQQMVELARAAAFQCSIIIFDEPTASLTDSESEALFTNIAKLKAQNVAVVYISHKLKEVFRLSDRVTVLRDGEVRVTLDTDQTDESSITTLMIGRELDHARHRPDLHPGDEILRVEGLTVPGRVTDASFALRKGEILGMYGLIGAGRSEMAEAIFGVRRFSAGTIRVEGREVSVTCAKDAVDLGIGLVPEDRKVQGLVLGLGCSDNVALAALPSLNTNGMTRPDRQAEVFSLYRDKLQIKTPDGKTPVGTLSGGNQQKIVIAKWLATKPRILILDEPTRGIDVGAKAEIYQLIGKLAAEGIAVLLISSELPEILALSSRVVTMYHGRITGEFSAEDATEDVLLRAAMGEGVPKVQNALPAT